MESKLSPIDELHYEKRLLRQECKESEERIAANFAYVKRHAGSILFDAALDSILEHFGFKKKNTDNDHNKKGGAGSIWQMISGGLIAATPIVWELAQPMLIKMVIRKAKSFFFKKKEKK